MFPQQGSGTNRSAHHNASLPSNSVPGIPGMPASAMVPIGGPSSGFALQHGLAGSIPLSQVPVGALNSQPNQNKMWPQPQPQLHTLQQDVPNQQLLQQPQHQKDLKHRDYLKQQQRLKAMPLSSSKGMSADALIGNLLDKKDTFTLRQSGQVHVKQSGDRTEQLGHLPHMRQLGPPVLSDQTFSRGPAGSVNPNDSLPGWLIPSSSRLPPIYSHIWSLVTDPTSAGTLVDTNKILALLLTSGLPKEVLGFIWNLATSGANVQLNQQQLYITLALVALAQMGCTFNNLSVLNFIPTPPIPSFNMSVPKGGADDKSKQSDLAIKSSASHASAAIPPPAPSFSAMQPPVATPAAFPISQDVIENDDDFGDEFTDFQSADPSFIPPPNPNNLCASLPATAVIQPSMTAKQVVNELNHSVVSKLGRSQGRSIGSRLANHHLGAPKSSVGQKPRRSSVEHDVCIQDDLGFSFEKNHCHYQDQKIVSNNQDSPANEDFSDFQFAAGLDVNVDELFPKCHPKPKNQDYVLKESAIRNESDDDEGGKQKEEELLAFDSPTSTKSLSAELKVTAPSTENARIVPPLPPPPNEPDKELMSIEEDKYSALRLIELENISSSGPEIRDVSVNEEADDFGDFVSADDMFAEIAVRETNISVQPVVPPATSDLSPPPVQNVEFPIDDWGSSVFQSSQPVQETDFFGSNLSNNSKTQYDNLTLAFTDLDISKEGNDPSKVDSTSKWSLDFDGGKESSSLTLNSNFDNSATQNDDEFGDFVGPSCHSEKSSSGFLGDQLWSDNGSNKLISDNKSINSLELQGVALSRHGSLPSLDLNLFPTSDDVNERALSSQVADWIRCLDSSCSLLQAAASTFTNITTHSILMEVLGSREGRSYLNNLLEVHRVTWRIERSYQRSGHESNQIDSVLGSVHKVWSTLQTFYKLANIESAVEKDGSDEESGQPACGVCGSPASRGVLEYGGHVYHAPCANLWLNCVDRTLPAHSPLL